MPPVNRKNTLPLPKLMLLIVVSCCLVQCTQHEETETKPDNRNLRNSASTFIYNMIPENASADISSEYSSAINAFSVDLIEEIYNNES